MASTDPKIATQGQWEDLADRVQSKAEIGTVLSTPSDVAYVGTNNIVDEAVTADKIDYTTLAFGNYSTSEVNTGFTWVDGKYIYKKSIKVDSYPNNAETSLGYLLPSQINIVKIEGTATAGTGVLMVGGVRPASSNGVLSARADQSTGQVLVSSGFDARSYGGYVTFYYTKTS